MEQPLPTGGPGATGIREVRKVGTAALEGSQDSRPGEPCTGLGALGALGAGRRVQADRQAQVDGGGGRQVRAPSLRLGLLYFPN